MTARCADQTLDEAIDALFADNGHWRTPQRGWGDPDEALQQAQFQQQLQRCIEQLPARTARVFVMRECLEQEVDEICSALGITANHGGVMLYRARMALRGCLQQHGFGVAR